jgi:tetratricopeptide (TPR) repeat protein
MKSGKSSKVMKWVGSLTAILALFAGVREIVKLVSDRVEADRKIDVLLSTEGVQLLGKDYRSAWASLEQASQINPDSAKIQPAQETLAMAWTENVRLLESEKFSDIADKVEPVLTRGVATSKPGAKQADLLAHIGWTNFLRSRDGRSGLDPAGAYAKAVEEDANNPYAQAMWGHWILWNHGKVSEAAPHFASAMASNREGDYVRRMQLSALFNEHNNECEEEIVRVLNAMRKEQRSIDPWSESHVFSIYYSKFMPESAETTPFINAVPPAEHLATFRWLFDKADLDESNSRLRSYYLAKLQEAAGQREDALANYRAALAKAEPGPLRDGAQAGIKRLSTSH